MRSPHPPRVATWILERLGTIDEALVGDLSEAFGAGGSRAWYWRQAAIAILFSVWREFHGHKLSALGAVVASLLCISLSTFTGDGMTTVLGRWTWTGAAEEWRDVFGGFVYRLPLIVMMALGGAVGGWLMMRLHGAERRALIFIFALFPLLSSLLWALRTIAAVTQGVRPFFTALCATLTFVGMVGGAFLTGFWYRVPARESAGGKRIG